ncbi:MAG: DNA polymerase III subunit alpha [Thermodesulfovibrionia bacterium]|nr:DNA polymerase III subunit alpha [Thermodesulfovibrionia bacterium]
MHSSYVPLHLHTHYSLLDGAIRIDDMIEKALEYKLAAIAITDHGNMFGAIEFYKKVSKAGLKPIIGCEVYVAPDSHLKKASSNGKAETSFHLILLCKDIHGYQNLTRLVSKAYLDGFYYKPRIDKDMLSQYSGGLIGLSACLKGEVSFLLHRGMVDEARDAALSYMHILGADNFYLEVQANELPEQDIINSQIIELGKDLHIGVVATNDCHYLNKEDSNAHDALLCIQTGKTLDDKERMRFSKNSFYFKSPDEIKAYFKDNPEVIENTKKVAERCNLDLVFGEFHLPRYNADSTDDLDSYLKRLTESGLKEKLGGDIPEEYASRLVTELKTINEMGFSSYFLIVWDFIKYAKSMDIPVGPGRGSAAGSLVAYSLDITGIDPMKYDLLFERFLNPDRVSMPDIDIDFCMDRRSEVIDYVTNKYGKDHVAQIITFGTMKARGAIRDVGRVMNMPYAEVDRVAKLIPFDLKMTLDKALNAEPQLKELYETNDEIKKLIDIAKRLEGLSRHASTHAAGIVISPEPLTDYLPLYKASNEDAVVTQYDMDAIKDLGLLKFDFLGLKTLTVIDKAEKIINSNLLPEDKAEAGHFSIKNIPLDDKETFDLLSSAKTTGIFQLESSGMRDLLVRIRPSVFEDLIALVALYRPGPLGSGMVDEFIKGKKDQESSNEIITSGSLSKLSLPELDKILKETHGIILYQEQVMKVAHKIANFTLAQADILRKAMGGKNPEEMEKLKNTFIEGAKKNKISEKKAEKLYGLILQFAEYGFNKSHSAAYALIAYQTAYLKTHYPVEFMAASLSSDMDNTEKVVAYIIECRDMDIEILPPDLNESKREFTVMGRAIRFGLEAVKGVGGSAIEAIISIRDSGRFVSYFDFCLRADSRKVNKKVIEGLIKAGAMDSFGRRAQLMEALGPVMDAAMKSQKEMHSGQGSMFDMHTPAAEDLPEVEEWSESKRLTMEKEALGFYISGHPLNKFKEQLAKLSVKSTTSIRECNDKEDVNICGIVQSIKKITTKKGDMMAALTIEDMYGTAEAVVFPDIYTKCSELLSQEEPIVIAGHIDKSDKGVKVIAKEVVSINDTAGALKAVSTSGRAARGNGREKPTEQKYRSLVLVMNNDTDPLRLRKLQDIFTKHSGYCNVFLKIISPEKWETTLSTDFKIMPSNELLVEVKNILGENSAILN